MWADIFAGIPCLNTGFQYPMTTEEIQTAVTRAKNHPLTIRYDGRGRERNVEMMVFCEEIIQHVARWKSVDMTGVTAGQVKFLRGVYLPLLESCELQASPPSNLAGTENLFAHSLPRLKHLMLSRVPLPIDSPSLSELRWIDLQYLSLSVEKVRVIMSRTLNLSHLMLFGIHGMDWPAPTTSPIAISQSSPSNPRNYESLLDSCPA